MKQKTTKTSGKEYIEWRSKLREFLDAGVLPIIVCMYIGGVGTDREMARNTVKENYIAKQYKF